MPGIIMAPEQLPPWALRTEIPTVVADMCEDACDLAVWRALRWLIALSGRDRLGVDARTIAAHAKVDVKTALRCINGDRPDSAAKRRPRHLKRGLVGLGLLEVVGTQAVGKLKPRPVYRIPRWIEEQNAHYTRELLARLGMESSPPAPPPGQTALPLDLDPKTEQAGVVVGGAQVATAALDPKTEQAARGMGELADPHADQADVPDPYVDQGGWDDSSRQQDAEEWRFDAISLDPHTDQARAGELTDLDPNSAYWKEGGREGGREGVISPPTSSISLRTSPEKLSGQDQPASVVAVAGRQEQGGERGALPPFPPAGADTDRAADTHPRSWPAQVAGGCAPLPPLQNIGTLPPPAPPSGEQFDAHPRWAAGVLPAHPLDLWRRACTARRAIDDDQLAVLASEHDVATGGHGWYWVGRAILAAALSEDIHTVAKVRRTLERWRAEDAYGSDAPAGRRSAPSVPPVSPRAERAGASRAVRASLSERMGLSDIFQEV